ncbi:hypothetical protein BU14_0674s0003 [Porphyra umbilicalis]|uniref:Uncharacterized protein n=1 Tax=Porphyra umbilicalis TaxID=2786 RepID=A0A1X6NQ19_PORUM|nr:hypothetical protein BU14_0674s0003 [Porphyra umbilicalis]|eukprot:OSX70739.1 hypothetical protein BU14_0674s0003 [Porphyra umbilicalis]
MASSTIAPTSASCSPARSLDGAPPARRPRAGGVSLRRRTRGDTPVPPPPQAPTVAPPLVLAAPHRLAAYTTPPTDLARLREPVLATVPYGVGASTRPRDVFVLLGNAGRVALRPVHAVMGALQSNRLVLADDHVAVLADVWADAARLLRLYVAVADIVWGRWVATVDARAAAAGMPAAPMASALARLTATLDGADESWAALAASRAPDERMAALFAALDVASGAAVAAFRRAEAVLPAALCGACGAAATDRAAAAAGRAAVARRAAEVGGWAAATAARPAALPAGVAAAADPARTTSVVLPPPVVV